MDSVSINVALAVGGLLSGALAAYYGGRMFDKADAATANAALRASVDADGKELRAELAKFAGTSTRLASALERFDIELKNIERQNAGRDTQATRFDNELRDHTLKLDRLERDSKRDHESLNDLWKAHRGESHHGV